MKLAIRLWILSAVIIVVVHGFPVHSSSIHIIPHHGSSKERALCPAGVDQVCEKESGRDEESITDVVIHSNQPRDVASSSFVQKIHNLGTRNTSGPSPAGEEVYDDEDCEGDDDEDEQEDENGKEDDENCEDEEGEEKEEDEKDGEDRGGEGNQEDDDGGDDTDCEDADDDTDDGEE